MLPHPELTSLILKSCFDIKHWVQQVGYYKLKRAKTNTSDWMILIDATIQMGEKKCVVALGCRAVNFCKIKNRLTQKQAFNTVKKYSGEPVDRFFFDVTTLYFESVKQDSIRDFGFSKDQKYHLVQIVFALVVDSQGMPLAYETFKGNLAETKTLIPVLEKLRERFSVT
jgi:hypothetical protein